MSTKPPPDTGATPDQDAMIEGVRQRRRREARARREGEPSVGARLAQIGVLGWIIVTPALLGVFAGGWLDRHFASGLFWTAPLLLVGIGLGGWSAWKWTHAQLRNDDRPDERNKEDESR